MTAPPFLIAERLPGSPKKYSQRDEDEFRRRLELVLRRSADAVVTIIQDSSGLPQRTALRIPLTSDEDQSGETALRGAGAVLLNVAAFRGGWFRLYASSADRTADSARVEGAVPTTPVILDVRFVAPSALEYRLFDGDVEGILAFNRDDPAARPLYYRHKQTVEDTSFQFNNFRNTPGENLSVSHPFEYNVGADQYYITSNITPNDTLQRKLGVTDDKIARLTTGAFPPLTTTIFGLWRNRLDSGSGGTWATHNVFYVTNGAVADIDKNCLNVGVRSGTGDQVNAEVTYLDNLGAKVGVASGDAFTWSINSDKFVKTDVVLLSGVPTARVFTAETATPNDFTLRLSAAVPSAITSLPASHDRVGLHIDNSDNPDGPLAVRGMGIKQWWIALVSLHVDLAYVPVERSGGTIKAE